MMLRAVIRRASSRVSSASSLVSLPFFFLSRSVPYFVIRSFQKYDTSSLFQGFGKSLQSSRVAASTQSFHSVSSTDVMFLIQIVLLLLHII